MVKIFNNRTLAISQKVYGWLLRAYPPSHREKYGPAMAQLFRDQCRDAWSKSRNRGVTKLWLRVLPDLVKTSFIERLAALTKRKSMTDKMTALMQPRTVFLKVFAVVFLLILCATVAITFIMPESLPAPRASRRTRTIRRTIHISSRRRLKSCNLKPCLFRS